MNFTDSWTVMLRKVLPGTVQPCLRYSSTSKVLDSIIRVDHAGELGADRIYAGQMAVLGKLS